jgi:cytochrome c553
MDVNMISKLKKTKTKKQKICLMGVCSNCHGHENNNDYKIFQPK